MAVTLQPEQLARIAAMSAADRAKRLRDVRRELESARSSLRIARIKIKGHSGKHSAEERAAVLEAEIERIKAEADRRIAMLAKQVKEIREEDRSLPAISERLRERIKELEVEEKLLDNGKLIKQMHGLLK